MFRFKINIFLYNENKYNEIMYNDILLLLLLILLLDIRVIYQKSIEIKYKCITLYSTIHFLEESQQKLGYTRLHYTKI